MTTYTPATEQDAHPDEHGDGHHAHPPHLAHHFDTPVQQYASGKLGMWVFLGTEILMFGGLFVAYAVYRFNHPEVFHYASQALNTTLGLINTIVLITSSLTMALAIHFIQKGNQKVSIVCLLITLAGGFGFMGIKSVEYWEKIDKGIFVGSRNVYSVSYTGEPKGHGDDHGGDHGAAHDGDHGGDHGDDASAVGGVVEVEGRGTDPLTLENVEGDAQATGNIEGAEDVAAAGAAAGGIGDEPSAAEQREAGLPVEEQPVADPAVYGLEYTDPLAGSADAVVIVPPLATQSTGTVAAVRNNDAEFFGNHNSFEVHAEEPEAFGISAVGEGIDGDEYIAFKDLPARDQQRVASFYGIYYAMTGLHGLHVLIGMGLIGWVTIKTAAGVFSPSYFTPVDLVGLYWHLVDLIWIFLFPLLYLM